MFHQYHAIGIAQLIMFQMFDVAGHRMCKTRLKMTVSCGRLTRTTQLHRTGHHCDADDDDDDDDDKDDDVLIITIVVMMLMMTMIIIIVIDNDHIR